MQRTFDEVWARGFTDRHADYNTALPYGGGGRSNAGVGQTMKSCCVIDISAISRRPAAVSSCEARGVESFVCRMCVVHVD